jgi:hypothetical protein
MIFKDCSLLFCLCLHIGWGVQLNVFNVIYED